MKYDNHTILDSREVIERLNGLRDEYVDDLTADDKEELEELEKIEAAFNAYGDWEYGEQIIPEGEFTSYIEELIDDCYKLPKELTSGEWPYRHITVDYEAAAEEAKQDYVEATAFGVTYLMRA